jgi:hypothetical protein
MRREENQLDVTECFIALMIRSTCFGHFYANHQELECICVLLPPMVCSDWLLVVGGQVQSSRLWVQEEGCCTCSIPLRAIILPIFSRARLCVAACGIMHPRCCQQNEGPLLPDYRPATSWVHYTTSCNTQSSTPEDGQYNCLKHVELNGIINKPLLLRLVGCLYYF